MSTCQTIIDNGFAKSAAARPESMMAPAELVARIGQCLRECFQVLARENPYIIGVVGTMNFDGFGWPRPSNCLRAIKVMADAGTIISPALAVGTEINVVPYSDQRFCLGLPSLTELGQAFVPTGQTVDPSAGTLALVFARTPIQPTTTTDSIDPLFPSMFDDFLQYDIAAYLAIKDKRVEDEQTFLAMKSALLQQIIEWTRGQTYSLQQRFEITNPPLTNTAGGRQQPTKGG